MFEKKIKISSPESSVEIQPSDFAVNLGKLAVENSQLNSENSKNSQLEEEINSKHEQEIILLEALGLATETKKLPKS